MRPVKEALARYLQSRMPSASDVSISNLSRIPGGASRETWMFDARWGEGGERRRGDFILRLDPPASLVESDREVEYTFYDVFAESEVPVPRMRWLEQDPGHLGAPFFIMDRILGCDSSPRVILEPRYQPHHPMLGRRMYETLGAIHRFDWRGTAIAKVVAVPAADEAWRVQLDYWEGMIDKNEQSPQPIIRAAVRWLRAHPPPPAQRVTVVHGDYRVGNFLYTAEGIHAVVDWEMAHLGDPLEDLAWSLHEVWEWGRDGKKGGIIDAEEATHTYESAGALAVDREALHWWDIFSGVKGQGIWLTGARSYADRRTTQLIMVTTAYWLVNFQDEVVLRSLGRGA
ncbi:MAG: phosphotransferase family protein [Tepidiformaceae bacterium]